MPALFLEYHPFIILSMATAIMSLFFYALRFHLGFILSYVMLANPAAILHQVFMIDFNYTETEQLELGIDLETFAWQSWFAITLTFAIFSFFAHFLRTTMIESS